VTELLTGEELRAQWPSNAEAGIGLALLVMGAVAGIFAGKPFWKTPTPSYQRLTFNRGTIWNARFADERQTPHLPGRLFELNGHGIGGLAVHTQHHIRAAASGQTAR
jgi:hypothetical protein